jgi:hypothetical protein
MRVEDIRVPLDLLRRYLRANGWRLVQTSPSGRELFLLSESGLDELEALLPATDIEVDAERRVAFVIETLSQLENTTPEWMANRIRSIGWDVIKARLPDHVVFRDSVKLRVAENFLRHARKLLQVTAATEINPLPYVQTLSEQALEYADSCRFGHTFKGSFGFTLESYVGPHTKSLTDDTPLPFERLVVQRLGTGMKILEKATELDSPEVVAENYLFGFNADMCDNLVQMIEATDSESVTFSFSLSPEWQSPDFSAAPTIDIRPRALEIARRASKQLRGDPRKASDPVTVTGHVIRLASKDNPADLESLEGTREIGILWEDEARGDLTVRVLLAPRDYLSAIEAHRNGRSVSVSGNLVKAGRLWTLRMPRDFKVL